MTIMTAAALLTHAGGSSTFPLFGTEMAIVTSFSDSVDLTNVAKELYALTTGTLSVLDLQGNQIDFTANDLTALNNRIPCAVKRIRATGTTVTRCLSVS
jgi:hypothetical protein